MGRNNYSLLIQAITFFVIVVCVFVNVELYTKKVVATPMISKEYEVKEQMLKAIEFSSRELKEKPKSNNRFIGYFKVTHYGSDCGGCNGNGITATGTNATEGRTVAVDPRIIPKGSIVLVNGIKYVAEDTGVIGNVIDIFVGTEERANRLGIINNVEVFLVENER